MRLQKRNYKAGGNVGLGGGLGDDRGLDSRRDNAGDGSPNVGVGNAPGNAPSGSPADNPDAGQVRSGGYGKSGVAHGYDGTSANAIAAGRPQLGDLGLSFDLGNLGLADVAKAVGGLALGANPLGIAAGLGASALGLSLGDLTDFDFSSGTPGPPQGKGPGNDQGTGGGPEGPARPTNPGIPTFGPTAPATEPASPQALREAADIQNYLSDLQRIALGQSDSRAALERFGVSPEQAMFNYRKSFPEFGDSMSNLSLAEIIKRLGNMSPNPAPFAEGGRVGDERVRPRPDTTSDPSVTDDSVSTDLSRFTKMLKDLMMMPSGAVDSQGKENSFGVSDKPQARRPLIPGGLIPPETGSPRYGGDAEAFRFKEQFDVTAGSPLNIIPEGARPEIEVERLAPPVAPAESTPTMDSEFNLSRRELTAFNTLTREGFSGREAMDRVKRMTPEQLDLMVEVANSPDGFKNGGETRRPAPGLLQDNPQRTATVEKLVRDKMESLGLTQEEAVKELQAMFRKSYPMSDTVPDYSFAGGGSVRGRRDALPLVEGDHVVPAHAVKGNEGGLAALSKKLMGNQSYDGMIRGPGGPREDAIKTRVYAAGGGISGKMDNLQNPFNSVPARVSNKEYVIPRQAITNLGMMNGAREGDANKVGQDIIYQLVENLKRKA